MTAIASSDLERSNPLAPLRGAPARLVAAIGLVALGDWFWRGPGGSAILLFVLALALAATLTNVWRAERRTLVVAPAALLLGALPLVESFGLVPLAFAFGGLAVFALLLTGQGTPGWLRRPVDVVLLWLSGPRRLFWDTLVVLENLAETGWGRSVFSLRRLAGWIVPLGLLGVFALLFADANPLVLRGLVSLDPGAWLPRPEVGRVFTWMILLLLVWPYLHVRLMPARGWRALATAVLPPMPASTPIAPASPAEAPHAPLAGSSASAPSAPPTPLVDLLLGREAIARSLVLFNLLFAVQTGLDAVYLWGGAELPAGTTYASYAHRGAYPLIVTALLAAGFVLVAMRPKGPGQGSPLLRGLVFLFVAQNVGLVLSSILRLDLYVGVYGLTYWRVAAFIWMGLVAIGLVLIGVRIALRQSNRWLIGANLAAATATLYCCCFVNFAALIAEYNVSHQSEVGLDLAYLASLGPDAIPAIDRLIPTASATELVPYYQGGTRRDWLLKRRTWLARSQEYGMADWRYWTLRHWRLSHYLATHPEPRLEPPLPAPPAVPTPAPVEAAPSPR